MSEYKYDKEITEVISRIVLKVIKTPATLPLVWTIVEGLLKEWSADSKVKKIVAYPVKKILPKGASSYNEKPATSMAADVGRLLTLLAVSINKERETYPDRHSWNRGETVKDFLVNTDFGEIVETVVKSEEGVKPTMDAFNEVLWTYPTKFTSIVAMLGPLARIIVKTVNEVLVPINRDVGPDLLADIFGVLLRDCKPEEIARLVDGVGEVIRKAHTGSLLIGKGDKSKLDLYLDDIMKAYHGAKNQYLQKMLPVYLGEIRESIANSSARSLMENEEIFMAQIASLGSVKSSDVKVKNARLRVYEAADKEKLGAVMDEAVKEFDTYEAADLVNLTCKVLNRLHDAKPDLIGSLLSGVVDSISSDEVAKTAQWLVPDVVHAVKPLAQAMMPELLKGLAELIRDDGYSGGKNREAVLELKAAMSSVGGAA
jgi:hypothetical protein